MHTKGIAKDIELPDLGAVRQTAGSRDATGKRFVIVVSRFNESLTQALVQTAIDCLKSYGATDELIRVVWVPGAYEIPSVVNRVAAANTCDAIIALGLVVEGETMHAEVINYAVGDALQRIAMAHHIPVIHEVVSVYNIEQAEVRCLGGQGSRGWYAAEAAIEMTHVFNALERL
ncbi:MAG: 6,7-dimethyl-8-ribityllumazine synthase [Spartobacteria bacterium]|nr:6,7-dimethyl-8-ribityllumazine synthase [Spartobacteria bacterium]